MQTQMHENHGNNDIKISVNKFSDRAHFAVSIEEKLTILVFTPPTPSYPSFNIGSAKNRSIFPRRPSEKKSVCYPN